MKTAEQWIEEIERKISELKNAGRTTYFIIQADMTRDIANKLALHFAGDDKYTTEFNRCHQCNNKYDTIITWRN